MNSLGRNGRQRREDSGRIAPGGDAGSGNQRNANERRQRGKPTPASTSQHLGHPCMCPIDNRLKSNHLREKKEKNCGTRSRETLRTGNTGPLRWGAAIKKSQHQLLFFRRLVLVKATEVISARQEEERRTEAGSQQKEETIHQPKQNIDRRQEENGRRGALASI